MRRIGEMILTIAIMIMVASLTLADQLRKKACGRKNSTEGVSERADPPVEAKSRADSIVMDVL